MEGQEFSSPKYFPGYFNDFEILLFSNFLASKISKSLKKRGKRTIFWTCFVALSFSVVMGGGGQ